MSVNLQSVVISKTVDGQWLAHHVPSGRKISGATMEAAQANMRSDLGLNDEGSFDEPITSSQFEGLPQAIALFLEGPISKSLSVHSGFARLDAFKSGVAHIRLGGGCKGCPSSQLTLFDGVQNQLKSRFGDDVIVEVVHSLN